MSRAGIGRGLSHAPKVGPIAKLLGSFHFTGEFWYRIHRLGARIVPSFLKPIGIRLFVGFFLLSLSGVRRGIADNLDVVLGRCGWLERQRRSHRTILNFAWCLTERYERLSLDVPFETVVDNRSVWDKVSSGGDGIVMVTAHVGNWEIGSAIPSSEEKRPVHVVREEEIDPRSQEYIRNLLKERMGDLYTTHFVTGDPTLAIRLAEALGRGEVIALQGDRPRTGGRTETVELFGRPFEIPIGPIALARAASVPLVPVFVFRTARRRYRLCFREPIRVECTADRRHDVRTAAASLSRSIEWAIREDPHQWFCFRSVWQQGRRRPEEGVKST